MLGRELEVVVQEIHALIELAETHVAGPMVVEEIWILRILAEEFPPDATSILCCPIIIYVPACFLHNRIH